MTSLPIIDEQQRYWLVRTEGGWYYNNFRNDNFIAIGWDKVNDIDAIRSIRDRKDEETMIKRMKLAYPEKQRFGHDLNQIRTFVSTIKSGDIILSPSYSSYQIAFGIVTSNVYVKTVELTEEEEKRGVCPFSKRRDVLWIKTLKRDDLDPYLYKLFFSHHTITDAIDYAPLIDRTLHSLFIKGDKAHLVLEIASKEEIFARDLTDLIEGLLDFADDFNDATGSNFELRNVEMKVNVQSPGLIELLSYSIFGILAIAGILTVVSGGKFNLKIAKLGTEVEIETEGLIEKIIQYKERVLTDKSRQKKIADSKKLLRKLQVKIPDELRDDTKF